MKHTMSPYQAWALLCHMHTVVSVNSRQTSVTSSSRRRIYCFVTPYFDYNDEVDIKGCAVSGLFVAVATNCQTMARDLCMQVQ